MVFICSVECRIVGKTKLVAYFVCFFFTFKHCFCFAHAQIGYIFFYAYTVCALKNMTNKEQAAFIGKTIGELAIKAGISEVVFDRGGYLYTGRVKELADGARSAGLKF